MENAGLHKPRRRIYVCHPYSDNPEQNIARVREICKHLLDLGHLPIAPHLYLPQLVTETNAAERDFALHLCLDMLLGCDEVYTASDRLTAGMEYEIDFALANGIPVTQHKCPT